MPLSSTTLRALAHIKKIFLGKPKKTVVEMQSVAAHSRQVTNNPVMRYVCHRTAWLGLMNEGPLMMMHGTHPTTLNFIT
jgi:hypothetical protein